MVSVGWQHGDLISYLHYQSLLQYWPQVWCQMVNRNHIQSLRDIYTEDQGCFYATALLLGLKHNFGNYTKWFSQTLNVPSILASAISCNLHKNRYKTYHYGIKVFARLSVLISHSAEENSYYTKIHFVWICRDHFVYGSNQWEITLHCNVFSHWLGAYTKWSLEMVSPVLTLT